MQLAVWYIYVVGTRKHRIGSHGLICRIYKTSIHVGRQRGTIPIYSNTRIIFIIYITHVLKKTDIYFMHTELTDYTYMYHFCRLDAINYDTSVCLVYPYISTLKCLLIHLNKVSHIYSPQV
jgi:hypothetical protein